MGNDCCSIDWHPFYQHRHYWGRRFLTEEEKQALQKRRKERKVQWLTQYKESLENELKGVTERLDEFKKEDA